MSSISDLKAEVNDVYRDAVAPGSSLPSDPEKSRIRFLMAAVLDKVGEVEDFAFVAARSSVGMFRAIADGLGATSPGEFFWVTPTAMDGDMLLYRNDAGAAVLVQTSANLLGYLTDQNQPWSA